MFKKTKLVLLIALATILTTQADQVLHWDVRGYMVGPFVIGVRLHGIGHPVIASNDPPDGANCQWAWPFRLPLTGTFNTTFSQYQCPENFKLTEYDLVYRGVGGSTWTVYDTFTLWDVGGTQCCGQQGDCNGEYLPGVLTPPCL